MNFASSLARAASARSTARSKPALAVRSRSKSSCRNTPTIPSSSAASSRKPIVARLEHPYIVPLYDYWREPGGAYLVMRYIRGGSLGEARRDGLWPLERITRLLEQVGGALAFAH